MRKGALRYGKVFHFSSLDSPMSTTTAGATRLWQPASVLELAKYFLNDISQMYILLCNGS